jgi:3-hydroxyacyl-[acyl-carrier-protein] dehydratase
MLKDNFFKIKSINKDESGSRFIVEIELDPGHYIYKGHFPGNPIVPGVCMQQIVKDLLSDILQKELFMKKAENMKFLSVIVPGTDKVLNVNINIKSSENNEIKIDSSISNQERVFFKFAAIYKIIS